MEITEVKVFPIQEEKLKAFVSIVFDQCFMVNDIKIIQGRDGLFISMPSRKKKNGEFKDVAHPLNNETRRMIEEQVLTEYQRVLGERGDRGGERSDRGSERLPAAQTAGPAPVLAPAAFPAYQELAAAGRTAQGAELAIHAVMSREPLVATAATAVTPATPATTATPPIIAPAPPLSGASGHAAVGRPEAADAATPASGSEKTLEEIEEMHLRDSFWTVT
jgi:stage V sporulation protein G